MKWLRKILGYRKREYHGDDFSVRIEPIFRENISVVYTRRGTQLTLDAARIGNRWQDIEVLIPQETESGEVARIVHDLEIAFGEMRYRYVIARKTETEIVSEAERRAAITELKEMGYNVEVLPDGSIRQTRRPEVPRADLETIRKQTPRILSLIQSVQGRRQHFEILAKSRDS